MTQRQTLAVGLLVVAALVAGALFLSGTAAVSSVGADRSLTGTVADDASAYFNVDITATDNNETANVTIEIQNNAAGDVTITDVVVTDEDGAVLDEQGNDNIGYGESVLLETDAANCGEPIHIIIAGDHFEVTLDRGTDCE